MILVKNIQEQVILFNEATLNNFHIFIPNKIIICNDKDTSFDKLWNEKINKKEKSALSEKEERQQPKHSTLNDITADASNALKIPKDIYCDFFARHSHDPSD